jgi:hypothetical protein
MTNEQINIAIAEARGIVGPFENRWIKEVEMEGGLTGYESYGLTGFYRKNELVFVADSCNCLNAMHEAEKVLNDEQKERYFFNLMCLYGNWPKAIQATATERAEAFLKTLGKWEEVK